MTLVRFNPLRDLVNIQSEMNRLFDDFYVRGSENVEPSTVWSPMVDISESDNEIVVVAELPGLQKEDVKIALQDNVLSLEGDKKQETVDKGKCYHRLERCYGKFQRSFVLPTAVKGDKVKAAYKDGILTITLPKAEEAKPKQIDISVQ
ncbi:Hsp20/alpha crystallin family protein [bacterium]|nr:Hsp20/alpha crystallin family protein [bacterium]